MHRFLLAGAALALSQPAWAASSNLVGITGLLGTPTAQVQEQASADFSWSQQPLEVPGSPAAAVSRSYSLLVGFLPGLELSGRAVEVNDPALGLRDLSFNAKYRLDLPFGARLAVGAQDIGGEAQNFRSRYAVGTLPWRWFTASAGYGWGPDQLKGAFGGLEYRPWQWLGLVAEHDTQDYNAGVKLATPELFGGLRMGVTVAYSGAHDEMQYAASVSFALGRRKEKGTDPFLQKGSVPFSPSSDLRDGLTALGFESLRLGTRASTTQVVGLENRTYNHSSADAVGLALGAIAARSDPAISTIELTLFAYGVPQLTVTVPAQLYRDYLADPGAHAAELRQQMVVSPSTGIADPGEVAWDPSVVQFLKGAELVVAPVLRTFVATEYGLLDYDAGARARLTVPIHSGLLFNLGATAPLVHSDDFGSGRNFNPVGIEGGLDLALVQYAHKVGPQWTWLWSAGMSQVYRTNLETLALEQVWASQAGTQQLRVKLMSLSSSSTTHNVALGGYTWFDPVRDYSLSLTAGRFYAGDSGWRLELSRYFGDTIVGLFFKAASGDDQAGGVQISLPLTPRRDAMPGGIQVKGPRRWSQGLSTTLNASDQRNPLRPVFLYEPTLDLDLRRDFYDSGRLGAAYLQDEVPRMYEAWETLR